MIEKGVEVVNRLGLHARAAAKLVQRAGLFRADVSLIKDGEAVDGKSILGVMGLGAAQGTQLTVRCDGEDEEAALAALVELIANRFEEPR